MSTPLFHSFPFTYNIKSQVNRAHKALLNLASTTVILPCHSRSMGILEHPASPRRHGLSCRCSFPHAVTSSVSSAGHSSPGQSFPPMDPCPDAVQPLRPSPPARPHGYFVALILHLLSVVMSATVRYQRFSYHTRKALKKRHTTGSHINRGESWQSIHPLPFS